MDGSDDTGNLSSYISDQDLDFLVSSETVAFSSAPSAFIQDTGSIIRFDITLFYNYTPIPEVNVFYSSLLLCFLALGLKVYSSQVKHRELEKNLEI